MKCALDMSEETISERERERERERKREKKRGSASKKLIKQAG
jgi:hypothetical protein